MKSALISMFSLAIILSFRHPVAGQASSSSSLNDQLIQAATNGDTAAVQQLLAKGANIESRNDLGDTALTSAALMGLNDVVELLLDRGANIDDRNKDGKSALDVAESFNGMIRQISCGQEARTELGPPGQGALRAASRPGSVFSTRHE
jgi:hypothetical protein